MKLFYLTAAIIVFGAILAGGGLLLRILPLTAATLAATCTASPLPAYVGDPVTYDADATGGSGIYTYSWTSWTATGGLSATGEVVQYTYDTASWHYGTVTVDEGTNSVQASCGTHVMPTSFSEPPNVNPVFWVPADVNPAPYVDQLQRSMREIRANAYQIFGKTFKMNPLVVIVSDSTEQELCGGDCTASGLVNLIINKAYSEAQAQIPIIPYERELAVMAWGAGGYAGAWGWDRPLAGIGDWAVSEFACAKTPALDPGGPAAFIGKGNGWAVPHEIDHNIGWTAIHNNDYFNPASIEPEEKAIALRGPWFYEDISDATPPTLSITSPADGATVSGTITLSVSVSDNVAMDAVVLRTEEDCWSVVAASPFEFSVDTTKLGFGPRTFSVKAYDATGNTATDSVTLNVLNEL